MSSQSNEQVYEKALKLLERRFHSGFELRQKLLLRGFDKVMVDQVIQRLIEQDLLNDERFAQIFLENLIKYKTFGFYGLQAKLKQRGIAPDLIAELLGGLSMEDEIQIARRLAQKKRGTNPARMARSLSAKGFRPEAIQHALGF